MTCLLLIHAASDTALVAYLETVMAKEGLSTRRTNGAPGTVEAPAAERAIGHSQGCLLFVSKEISTCRDAHTIWKAVKGHQSSQDYPVVPVLLPDAHPAALNGWYETPPEHVALDPADIERTVHQIKVGLGLAEPLQQTVELPEIPATPLAELTLNFRDLTVRSVKKKPHAAGQLVVSYQPRDPQKHPVHSASFAFRAPLSTEEFGDLRWYLERYADLPMGIFRQRARDTETCLEQWGSALYKVSLGHPDAQSVLSAWKADAGAKRISIFLDPKPPHKPTSARARKYRSGAAQIFALPWELLRHHDRYLFRGGDQVRVRRNLPKSEEHPAIVAQPPIRVLLVVPRPEDKYVGYIDHRASGKPLVEAIKNLGSLVELTVLDPPTYPALNEAIKAAGDAQKPFHVLHFDGHGVYNPQEGLGQLVFEAPDQEDKLQGRKPKMIKATDLGEDLAGYGLPLVVLDACETGQSEDVGGSVAASLLRAGVRSVLAMSHAVLVETAKRFNAAFYPALARGARIGDAVLKGQHALRDDDYRGKVAGGHDLHLQDWFVPVLFQEAEDPPLFHKVPGAQIQALVAKRLQRRLGRLPDPPDHKFHGRAHLLMVLERQLRQNPYVAIVGQGGLGKTTLATELARWLVESQRFQSCAFVSMEHLSDAKAVVNSLGQQLLHDGARYNAATYPDMAAALKPILQRLAKEPALLVMDNLESILPRPSEARDSEVWTALQGFLDLWEALSQSHPQTRLLFTSREKLPAPFDAHYRDPGPLHRRDGIALVQGILSRNNLTVNVAPGEDPEAAISQLVEAVGGHARALVLLTPELAKRGLQNTFRDLQKILATMPDDRERGLYASLALSLKRLPPETIQQMAPLALFHSGVNLRILPHVLEVEVETAEALVQALMEVGLARNCGDGHFSLDPALPNYLAHHHKPDDSAQSRWLEAMQALTHFLYGQQTKDGAVSARLTLRELPNLMAMIDQLARSAPPETVVVIAGRLERLLSTLGKTRALARVVTIRQEAAKNLGQWSHAAYLTARGDIERLLEQGDGIAALKATQKLLETSKTGGEQAFPEAPYDTAMIYDTLGHVLRRVGHAAQALPQLEEARTRFQTLAKAGNTTAERMASVCLTESGDCLQMLGLWDKAVQAYETAIQEAHTCGYRRQEATGMSQLGSVLMDQKNYGDALKHYGQARHIFETLNEPGSLATIWHQIAMIHEEQGHWESAEKAYRQSLNLEVSQNNHHGQATTLGQLGNLYLKMNRLDQSASLIEQAAEIYQKLGDTRMEGFALNNLAGTLVQQKAYGKARQVLERAIQCRQPFGHSAGPWKAFNRLRQLEEAEGNHQAAAEARAKSRAAFLAYRRDGGENHSHTAKLCSAALKAIQNNETQTITSDLQEITQDPEWKDWHPLANKLQAILAGDHNPQLYQDPTLDYDDATELQLLLEALAPHPN